MAVSRTTTASDWMINPGSYVFKTFDEPILKSPFSSPHLVPEKILESFIDQNNIRFYRVKWIDSWLSEPHVASVFPQLITEYWLNKPISETLDYQTFESNTSRSIAPIAEISNSQPINIASKGQRQQLNNVVVNENQLPSASVSTTLTLPQFFPNVTDKENFQRESVVTQNENSIKDATLFSVGESLTLPEKFPVRSALKDAKKSSDIDTICANQDPNTKLNEQSVVLLLDKNLSYTANLTDERDKLKSMNLQLGKIHPRNLPNFDMQTNQTLLSSLPLPSMEQMHQLNQQITNQMQQTPVTPMEKKVLVNKKPATQKPSKSSAQVNKDKQPVPCDICGKIISSRKNLRIHKTVKHFKNGSFSCQICGRNFALNRDLQRHMPLHTNERNYVCQYCGLQCKQPGHLTKHIRTHTEVMNWRCDCCFKNFRVQSDLKAHCFSEHKDIVDKNLHCSVCKEKLKLPNSVYLHSLRHSGVREFECHVCKATFKLKQHMQVHMKTHNKSKTIESHECPICMKVFRSKILCTKHASKHEEKTAEEFQEKIKIREENKIKLKEQKLAAKKHRLTESSSTPEPSNDEETEQSEDKSKKRKQKKPSKVSMDQDHQNANGKVRKSEYTCSKCPDVFKCKLTLRNHMKLHNIDKNKMETETSIVSEDMVVSEIESDLNEKQIPSASSNKIPIALCEKSNENDRVDLRLPVAVTMSSLEVELNEKEISEKSTSVENDDDGLT